MTTALVTGASGFLGRHLVRELLAAGGTVRGLSRGPASDAAIAALGASPVRGDLGDAVALADAARGVDVVFHTAADTSTWTPGDAAQTETNVGGTRRLLAAAAAAGAGFVHTSSVSAYSHLVHETLREDLRQRGDASWINYERSKHAAECAVRDSGLPWLVFQPSHILGPGDTRNWSRLFGLLERGDLPFAPPGSGAFADVREVARAQVRGWQSGWRGEAFLLGGEHASFAALLAEAGRQLGRPTPKVAPAWLLHAYARVVDGWSRLTRREPEVTPAAAVFTCKHLRVDSGKAERLLGYRATPIPALVADTIGWMRAEGLLAAQPPRRP